MLNLNSKQFGIVVFLEIIIFVAVMISISYHVFTDSDKKVLRTQVSTVSSDAFYNQDIRDFILNKQEFICVKNSLKGSDLIPPVDTEDCVRKRDSKHIFHIKGHLSQSESFFVLNSTSLIMR